MTDLKGSEAIPVHEAATGDTNNSGKARPRRTQKKNTAETDAPAKAVTKSRSTASGTKKNTRAISDDDASSETSPRKSTPKTSTAKSSTPATSRSRRSSTPPAEPPLESIPDIQASLGSLTVEVTGERGDGDASSVPRSSARQRATRAPSARATRGRPKKTASQPEHGSEAIVETLVAPLDSMDVSAAVFSDTTPTNAEAQASQPEAEVRPADKPHKAPKKPAKPRRTARGSKKSVIMEQSEDGNDAVALAQEMAPDTNLADDSLKNTEAVTSELREVLVAPEQTDSGAVEPPAENAEVIAANAKKIEAQPMSEWTDFPDAFDVRNPEDFFTVQSFAISTEVPGDAPSCLEESESEDLSGDVDSVATERRRRGRSRRGGRNRRKSAQTQQGDNAVHAQECEQAPFADSLDSFADVWSIAAENVPVDAKTDEPDSAPAARQEQQQREKRQSGGHQRGGKRGGKSSPVAEVSAPDEDIREYDLDEDVDLGDSETGAAAEALPAKTGKRKMFVSVLPEEQVEVVITEEGQVQEYYVEMLHQAKIKGNIYKGIIHNVDPNLQAAFVSYGAAKNGFLQIDEVHPEYYVAPHEAGKGRKYPPIQKVLKSGQEVLVQVVKEPAGTKGAFLTTYLSLPGRFLVLTPGREQIGVSRKVENEGERARLRELLEGLSPGPGLGVIVRTVSMGASKTSLQRDLQFLKRTWKEVRTRGTTEKAPHLIYQEMDLTSRAVRDYLTEAVMEVWIDDEPTAEAVTEIADALFPRKQGLVKVHNDISMTLFERFNLQRQLEQIHSREVALPSGGRLVIDPTEALTAIDINSGRSGGKNNFEDMAFRTNMEAAKMIPLQLRLRDIGGQVVADFIEMRDKSHWREVEKTLRAGMKADRARYDVGKIGPFGMLEIVRQRLGSSAISISTEPCPHCNGTGVRRNMEWRCQYALREIQRALRSAQAQEQTVVFYPADQALAMHLLNHKRQRLLEMERAYSVRLELQIKVQDIL